MNMTKELAWCLGKKQDYTNLKLITGYERHYIRGLLDANGSFGTTKKQCRIAIVSHNVIILAWVISVLYSELGIPQKNLKYNESHKKWKYQAEGTLARVIAWWLYHGDIEKCCLERKRQKYLQEVADGRYFNSEDEALLYAAKAYMQDNSIHMNKPSMNTLTWCHILQKGLSFNTTPVFHNSGKRKYYLLHISNNKTIIDTQDAQEIA